MEFLEPFAKHSFLPNSALCSKFYPLNIIYMPAVKFFACLDFERKSKFLQKAPLLIFFGLETG
jgi:hypothetical protein